MVYMYHSFLTHSSDDGHLGCFHVLAIIQTEQYKEIEENNRMENTRDILMKIRDTKGIFHAKLGSIKDRKSMNLTEAEDIKKRWQEYTRRTTTTTKNDLNVQANYNGVIIHLESNILEGKVNWALEIITMNKASRDDGISAILFQILKDDSVKVLESICQKF